MCYPDGGVVDDLLVYKYTTEHYLLVVNAANTDKDFEDQENAFPGVEIETFRMIMPKWRFKGLWPSRFCRN